jgi:hypothetical protein
MILGRWLKTKLAKMPQNKIFAHIELLRAVPNFPNYNSAFGYPERTFNQGDESMVVFGPPLIMYNFVPSKNCTVHVSGIPDWATMGDLVEVFTEFGKIFSIELCVRFERFQLPNEKKYEFKYSCKGSALVTFAEYSGAQNACFAHLTRRIGGN